MRGTDHDRQHRFIPACAGNSQALPPQDQALPVHPRVCGEQRPAPAQRYSSAGSSPRVRGTVDDRGRGCGRGRFIPACAGNSRNRPGFETAEAVHPRVCGEQCICQSSSRNSSGSSPRVRGTALERLSGKINDRFIPACAGNSFACGPQPHRTSVHPRVCGEQRTAGIPRSQRPGSSPRVRGTAWAGQSGRYSDRFIPACAGNRDIVVGVISFAAVHPRVCGEQAILPQMLVKFPGSSPRVRGTGMRRNDHRGLRRFIPACAGNRGGGPGLTRCQTVHPRVCGEQV